MTGKVGLVAGLASVAFGLAGCATCNHKACAVSLCPPSAPDTCAAQRNRVHVFLVGGADVFDDGGLRELRDVVNAAGFSQVYYGQIQHCGWFEREARRIACDDPEARFVFVGYGVGAGNAVRLAAGRPGHVDGLVLLDPAGVPECGCTAAGAPVHVIGSERWTKKADLTGCDVVRLPGVCHFALATDPLTVEKTLELLREAVARVPDDAIAPLVMPMIDDPAPLPAVIPDSAIAPKGRPPAGTLTSRPAW